MHNCENSTPPLINCTFEDNKSEFGGGLSNVAGVQLSAEGCTFQNNLAYSPGGAVYNDGAQTTFIHCQFISNTGDRGSAIYSCEQTELAIDG
jgi:hypothetical protein